MSSAVTLKEFLKQDGSGVRPASLAPAIQQLAKAARRVRVMAMEPAAADRTVQTGTNPDGDSQIALDVLADGIFLDAARQAPVAVYASEERQEPLLLDSAEPLAIAVHPLDGSSNVDLNLSFGTIFSILPMPATGARDPSTAILQQGSRQLAAGLFIYGPQLALVLSVGEGTHIFSDSGSAGDFVLIEHGIRIPKHAREFAINASNYRHWDDAVRLYFDDCVKGVHGPREQDFNMRWYASLVIEAYRILRRGGVFLYPADRRAGYGNGRLRLVYEANPIAFLIEQAGGSATNGVDPILSLTLGSLHQRTPLIFGSRREVAKLTRYHTDPSAIGERSPLFGHRSLFRV